MGRTLVVLTPWSLALDVELLGCTVLWVVGVCVNIEVFVGVTVYVELQVLVSDWLRLPVAELVVLVVEISVGVSEGVEVPVTLDVLL